jgi:hypothetical protein
MVQLAAVGSMGCVMNWGGQAVHACLQSGKLVHCTSLLSAVGEISSACMQDLSSMRALQVLPDAQLAAAAHLHR